MILVLWKLDGEAGISAPKGLNSFHSQYHGFPGRVDSSAKDKAGPR